MKKKEGKNQKKPILEEYYLIAALKIYTVTTCLRARFARELKRHY